jgi:hypothetical protein
MQEVFGGDGFPYCGTIDRRRTSKTDFQRVRDENGS